MCKDLFFKNTTKFSLTLKFSSSGGVSISGNLETGWIEGEFPVAKYQLSVFSRV